MEPEGPDTDAIPFRILRPDAVPKCSVCQKETNMLEDWETGDMVCEGCGAVQAERMIDPGSEWRNFADSDNDRSRAQAADEMTTELHTTVGHALYGAKPGAMFDGSGQRLGKLQSRITGSQQERKMQSVFERIQHYGGLLRLTADVLAKSKKIYQAIEEQNSQKIRSAKKEPLVMAIIYIACKMLEASRTFRELSKAAAIDERDIRKYYRNVVALLPENLKTQIATESLAPSQLVNRFCSLLKLQVAISELAARIADKAVPFMEGKNPSSIAAASIFAAAKILAPQMNAANLEKDVANAAHIAAGTVKNVYKEIMSHANDIIPPEHLVPKPAVPRTPGTFAVPATPAQSASAAVVGTPLPPKI